MDGRGLFYSAGVVGKWVAIGVAQTSLHLRNRKNFKSELLASPSTMVFSLEIPMGVDDFGVHTFGVNIAHPSPAGNLFHGYKSVLNGPF